MTPVTFLHMLGISLWVGGVLAALVIIGATPVSQPAVVRGAAYRLLGRVYAWIVAPGAIATTASGLGITVIAASQGWGAGLGEPAVVAMQGVGLLAGILEIFVSFPMSQKLARVASVGEPDALPAVAELLRSRVAKVSGFALALVIVALYFGVAGSAHLRIG